MSGVFEKHPFLIGNFHLVRNLLARIFLCFERNNGARGQTTNGVPPYLTLLCHLPPSSISALTLMEVAHIIFLWPDRLSPLHLFLPHPSPIWHSPWKNLHISDSSAPMQRILGRLLGHHWKKFNARESLTRKEARRKGGRVMGKAMTSKRTSRTKAKRRMRTKVKWRARTKANRKVRMKEHGSVVQWVLMCHHRLAVWLYSITQYWMLCLPVIVAFSLSLWKSRRFACGTGLAICFITRSVCNFDPFDFPLNLPMKALCSSAPPLHPQYIHGYCNSFTWPWFLHSPQRESGLSPLRNYASSGAGARIISELTSPTHGVPKSSFLGYFTDSLDRKIHIPPPFVILEDRISDGECWRISGNTGQVGVRLSAPIVISHITFDYVSSTLLAPIAIAAAPRNMSLWILIDDIPEFKSLANDVRKTSEFVARGKFKKAGVFIRIADFQYNVSLAASQQRFPVQRHLSAPTQDVVLRVENNEGGDTTCIYWVGIHGHPG